MNMFILIFFLRYYYSKMNLEKDSQYYLIKNDDTPDYDRVSCFYFSNSYSPELFSLFERDKKLASLTIGKIMTHTYFKFITRNMVDLYYRQLLFSRFNICVGRTTFNNIRQLHSL